MPLRSFMAGAATLFLVLPAGSRAAEPLALEDIVISAGRTPVAVANIGRSYTVVTGEQLRQRQVRYVADALRQVPGLAVSRSSGSIGGLTQIRVRGAESNQVLVLIDGVEVSSILTGEFDFGGLVAADIERIEVLRGPQSALYGSNAAAGVISIITRGGTRNEVSGGVTLEGGSDATALVSGHLRAGGESWDAALSAALRRTDGFDVSTPGGGERDGDRNITVNAKGNWDLTGDLKLGATVRFTDRESEFDGFDFSGGPGQGTVFDEDDVNDQTEFFVSAFGAYEMLDDALVHELRFEFTDSDSTSTTDGVPTFTSDGTRYHGSYQASYGFDLAALDSSHVVTAAVEFESEVYHAPTGDQTRELYGLIGEWRGSFLDVIDLQAGVRQDFNDGFKDATTYSVAAAYTNEPTGTRLHGSVGTGVTNPTFFEQFGFSPGFFIGNPELRPERTFGWDIGVGQSFLDGALVADATYFRARVSDEIAPGFNVNAGLPTSVNAPGESRRQGVELSLTATPVDALSLIATYTFTDSEDGATGLTEERRPRHAASLDVNYRFLRDRAGVNLEVIYTGPQVDSDFRNFFTNGFMAERTTLDDHVLVNLAASYRINETVELFARVENLTDADYQEVFGFTTQGISGFAGLRMSF
ncbi:MAG: TonB-dependent receptor plug domain-containing protein [Paracoccaceae bacterium]